MAELNIAIVGAGLMGRLLAWDRARKGDRITLFDRGSRSGTDSAGLTAAAMIAPGTEAVVKDQAVFSLGETSLYKWHSLLEILQNDTGESVYFNTQGTLVVAHADDVSLWNGFRLMAEQRPGESSFKRIGNSEIQELEPELGDRFKDALLFPEEGVIGNGELFSTLELAIDRFNVGWNQNYPVNSPQSLTGYDFVFDTRGMGAGVDHADLRGVRGEVIRVCAPEVGLRRPVRLLHPRYPIYIAPHGGNEFVVGATEIESDATHPVTVRSALELLSALYTVHPGFGEAEILSLQVNCRPAYPDNLPRIRIDKNVIAINGLYRHGYLFAPTLLDIVNGLIDGEQGDEFPWLVEYSNFSEQLSAHG